ncbi:MAG: NAD(P)H-hydrate epimerase, partial [Treponemataceae bacterium]|nr:NAD(P)H-hydrate epimerase [Treponemataceae bacterium]
MMENAAAALERAVDRALADKPAPDGGSVLVLCGGGNNGGDGLALSRRLAGRVRCAVCLLERPKAAEAVRQEVMARAAGVPFVPPDGAVHFLESERISAVVDCIFGTGFRGVLDGLAARLISCCNGMKCARIACDVPSGVDSSGRVSSRDGGGNPIAFHADVTVTMGALKAALFSDSAKECCGEIVCAPLGVSRELFESCGAPDAWLLEASDIRLPVRTKKSAHKGNFGHAAVVLGEKPGAGIIAGTAALGFGAGLVTAVRGVPAAEAFAMSPELL